MWRANYVMKEKVINCLGFQLEILTTLRHGLVPAIQIGSKLVDPDTSILLPRGASQGGMGARGTRGRM